MNRPMWMHYPSEKAVFAMDDQFLVGSDLLVKVRCPTHLTSQLSASSAFHDNRDRNCFFVVAAAAAVAVLCARGKKAVAVEGQVVTQVYFPAGTRWFEFVQDRHAVVDAPAGGGYVSIDTPLDTIPAFQRAGSIVPLKMRLRRCSALMQDDPMTLQVALDQNGAASGAVYVDDEQSFA